MLGGIYWQLCAVKLVVVMAPWQSCLLTEQQFWQPSNKPSLRPCQLCCPVGKLGFLAKERYSAPFSLVIVDTDFLMSITRDLVSATGFKVTDASPNMAVEETIHHTSMLPHLW